MILTRISAYWHLSWLPALWFLIIALEIALYLMLDGADLGIGIRSLFVKDERRRGLMMQVIGPIWDANETWLVVAGGTLFGAFPLAYGVMLSALYVPVMLLIFALILRAVSFAFYESSEQKHFWGRLFGIGSLLAAVGQGCMAGGLVSGITVTNNVFSGGVFDWATPITLVLVVIIIIAYVCTGSAYMVHKQSPAGTLRRMVYPLSLIVLALGFIGVSFHLLPFMVPPSITIFQAAASMKTLTFMLYGIGPLIPIIFAYNLYLYRVFRQERTDDGGYLY